MKIKKVNEISSNFSKKELENIRNRKFPGETITEYDVWGEDLKHSFPDYFKLFTGNSIDDCVKFYNQEKNWPKSRIHTFDNILLIERKNSIKMIDFDIYTNSRKYNI